MSELGRIDPAAGPTAAQLTALEQLAAQATPGPWSPVLGFDGWTLGRVRQHQASKLYRREDFQLAAALSPDVVQALVAEIRHLRQQFAAARTDRTALELALGGQRKESERLLALVQYVRLIALDADEQEEREHLWHVMGDAEHQQANAIAEALECRR